MILTLFTELLHGLQHHLFNPLMRYTLLLITTHFTPRTLLLQSLVATASFELLPAQDVAASLFLLNILNVAVPFTLLHILSFLFPARLYQREINAAVACYHGVARSAPVAAVKLLVWHARRGSGILATAILEVPKDVKELWRGIKLVPQWVRLNDTRAFIKAPSIVVADVAAPIEPEPEPETIVERSVSVPLVEMRQQRPVKGLPPRYPSPFRSPHKSNFTREQADELIRKGCEAYRRAEAGMGPKQIFGSVVVTAKPIITSVRAAKPMIRKPRNRGRPATAKSSREETIVKVGDASRGVYNDATEESHLELPAVVNNTSIECMPPKCARDEVRTNKEEGILKAIRMKEKNEKDESSLQVYLIQEEAELIGDTMNLQKTETPISTPQPEANKAAIPIPQGEATVTESKGAITEHEAIVTASEAIATEREVIITKRVTMVEPERTTEESKQGWELKPEEREAPRNNPAPEFLSSRTSVPDVATAKGTISVVFEVTTASKAAAALTPQVPQICDEETAAKTSECPTAKTAGPTPNIKAPTPAWIYEMEDLRPPRPAPEMSTLPYLDGFAARMQDAFFHCRIAGDTKEDEIPSIQEFFERLELEVTGAGGGGMVNELGGRIEEDEEMQEAPIEPQMIDDAHLYNGNLKGRENTMGVAFHAPGSWESQEMEIEEIGPGITSSQEMEVEMSGLEFASTQEMEIDPAGFTSGQMMGMGTTGLGPVTPRYQQYIIPPHIVAAPSLPVQNLPSASILTPAPVINPTIVGTLPAQVTSNSASGSITHPAAAPKPARATTTTPALAPTEMFATPVISMTSSSPPGFTSYFRSSQLWPSSDLFPEPPASTNRPLRPSQLWPEPPASTTSPLWVSPWPISDPLPESPLGSPSSSVNTVDSVPAPTQTQRARVASTATVPTPHSQTSEKHHESVTATDETVAPAKIPETVETRNLNTVPPSSPPQAQHQVDASSALVLYNPTREVETATTPSTDLVLYNPIRQVETATTPRTEEEIFNSTAEAVTPGSRAPSPEMENQIDAPSALVIYIPTRHVETAVASSSRVPTLKRRLDHDANPSSPSSKRPARTIAPLKKTTAYTGLSNASSADVEEKRKNEERATVDVKGKGKAKSEWSI